RRSADATEVALDHARGEAARAGTHALAHRLGQLDDLDGARAIRQPPDEATLLERSDQAVDARFGAQVERVLHLVEGRRHARFLQALMDEAQELELLAGQHLSFPPFAASSSAPATRPKQIMNRTLYVPYVFCNHLIWG